MIAWTKAGYKLRAISIFLCMYDEFTSCLFSCEFMKGCCPLIHAKCLQNNILKWPDQQTLFDKQIFLVNVSETVHKHFCLSQATICFEHMFEWWQN